jgi:cytochrome c biogenesis protein CcdA
VGELVLVGVVAGFLAAISPCILPVLPVILVAGARPGDIPPGADDGQNLARRGRAGRPFRVILGLVLSFSLLILIGSELLSLLHLPQDALHDAGIALLVLVGLGYLVPPLGALLERPFARVRARRPAGRGGFLLGLALGLVYVPCAGPILAAITVVGATHRVGFSAVILTAAFALGTSVPLLAFALGSGELTGRLRGLRRHAQVLRMAGGAVLVVTALLIGFNVLAGLQRDVPGYSTALQGSAAVRKQLSAVAGDTHAPATLTSCSSTATTLVSCGPAHEHVVSNVRAQAAALGVRYPVAVDDAYRTWDAYDNEYWPADYLIDSRGDIRHVHFGEGDYADTEQLIRQLLKAAHPHVALPPPTSVPDKTPTGQLSPETYLGYTRLQYLVPTPSVPRGKATAFQFPARLPLGGMAWSGTWTDNAQEATAGPGARLELSFLAQHVYLVLGGHGSIDVTVNGRHVAAIEVAGVPRLYPLYQAGAAQTGRLELTLSPGVQAYDFTFG